jgi:hypothetical protein
MRPDLAAKRLAEIQSKKQSRKEYWQPVAGPKPNRIRILPRWDLDFELAFYRETKSHRNLGLERNKQAVCLIAEGAPKCPACALKDNLYGTKEPSDAEYARSILAKTKVFYNIVDLDDIEKGVQIWTSGIDVLEQLLAYVSNPKYGDIADPVQGRNIDLYFTDASKSKSGFNSYRVQPDPDRTEIQDPSWLEKMHNLDELVKVLSFEELDAIIYGREDLEDPPSEPGETPAPVAPPAPPAAAIPPAPPAAAIPAAPKAPPPAAAAPVAAPVAAPPSAAPKGDVASILDKLRAAKKK